MYVYEATIEHFDRYESSIHDTAFFATPGLAEAWIAVAQSKIAPESAWKTQDDGSSAYGDDGEFYIAEIGRVQIHESLESKAEEDKVRLERIKDRLGLA